ncbi:phage tail protein [Dyella sp. M7H15-1]|uniref:phage tail protein n=1 Tax=Dyella sp. M7H15-1 TaxID=2501295 RepID=UPI001004E024|nr:phage tail protein [Dyella sp. M7H15-1]QAU22895.1 phage tail protein [Dyella sp. M7H15-1]
MASTKQFHASIVLGGLVSGALKNAFRTTESALGKLGTELKTLSNRQKLLGDSIRTFGRMGKDVESLRSKYAQVTGEVDRLATAHKRLQAAQKTATAMRDAGRGLQHAGFSAGVAGAAGAVPLGLMLRESNQYQTEMARVRALGFGEQAGRDAQAFSSSLKTAGTSKLENLTLMRDAMSVFGDEHHAQMVLPLLAKMKYGNEAVFGAEQGAQNEQAFMNMLKTIELRGGLASPVAFAKQANMVQQVIAATGGRVSAEDWIEVIKRGGLAAKGMDDKSFYYGLEPLVQELGGSAVGTALNSAYQNLYQGRTSVRAARNLEDLGLIGDKSKVVADKAGQVKFLDPGALKGADLFRTSQYEWMKQVLLPTLAEKGITSKDQVLDAIGSIFTNRKAADLFGTMYLQQANIDKSARVNAEAYDIDQLSKEGAQTAEGKQLMAMSKLHDAWLVTGEKVLPLWTRAIELASGVLDRFNVFAQNNPGTVKAIAVGLGLVSGALLTLSPVLLTLGAGLRVFAFFHVSVVRFLPVLRLLGSALGLVGQGVLWLGRAFLMNPIGLAITAIALGAYLIIKHWDAISAFMATLWQGITQIFRGAWDVIAGIFTLDGARISQGWNTMCDGFKSYLSHVWEGIKGVFQAGIDWVVSKVDWVSTKYRSFKKFLGMDSGPADIKWYTGAPGEEAPRSGAPALAPVAMRGRGAMTQTNTFNIVQQPGESSDALARRVAALTKMEHQQYQRTGMMDPAWDG